MLGNSNQKMNKKTLCEVALGLVKNGKGILAIDESPSSLEGKFQPLGIENSEENRQKYRECLITTEGLENTISGAILQEETFFQKRKNDGKLFTEILKEKGIYSGIKLDLGLENINYNDVEIQATNKNQNSGKYIKYHSSKNSEKEYTELISKGVESLDERLASGDFGNAHFAKWRCLFTISEFTPTYESVHKNCEILAKYASICQKYNIVPVVEPEILFSGNFSIEEHYRVFKSILSTLVQKLNEENVIMEGVLFKTGFVAPGNVAKQSSKEQVAQLTNDAFNTTLPDCVPGVVFLSGGHSYKDSVDFLSEICKIEKKRKLTYSYGRALTDNAMKEWKVSNFDFKKTQAVLRKTCEEVSKASLQ